MGGPGSAGPVRPRPGTATGPGREEQVVLWGLAAIVAITCAWWALALWPVGDAPVWLQRTRYVCFGVTESGLPDAAGWVGLVAGPGGMLAVLAVGFWGGVRGLAAQARCSVPVRAALGAMALALAVLFTGAAVRVQAARAPVPFSAAEELPAASYPRLDREAAPLVLTGHDGVTMDLTERRGRPVLLTFAYAHCATVCPVVVQDALRARELLRERGVEADVLVVTLDPWRDTPSQLPRMAEGWGMEAPAEMVLGGDVAAVEAALDAWQVPRTRDEATGIITHPALTYVIDAGGRVVFASNGRAETLAALAERL